MTASLALPRPWLFAAAALLALGACVPSGRLPEPTAETAAVPTVDGGRGWAPLPAAPVAEAAVGMPGRLPGVPRRGVLTAGDIDDTLNLAAFERYLARAGRRTGLPALGFGAPVALRLVGPDGRPAPGLRATVRRPGAAEPFWDGYAGVDGNITAFPALHGAGQLREVEVRVFDPHGGEQAALRLAGGGRQDIRLPFDGGWRPDFLDLAFVVDTTGSMGDELEWLTRELSGIVRAARRAAPGLDVRYGLIVYRDHGDDYVVRNYGFTESERQMLGWLRSQGASGGGDYPEAAAAALRAGAGLNWRRGRGERLMFHIADAPPHPRDARAYLEAVRMALRKDVQVFGLGASGVAEESEYLMRQAAAATRGRYLFLTDDSGVGLAHAEPTISCYRVTRLTGLMVRVLQSELGGRRIEAGGGEVLREVGSYDRGVCRD